MFSSWVGVEPVSLLPITRKRRAHEFHRVHHCYRSYVAHIHRFHHEFSNWRPYCMAVGFYLRWHPQGHSWRGPALAVSRLHHIQSALSIIFPQHRIDYAGSQYNRCRESWARPGAASYFLRFCDSTRPLFTRASSTTTRTSSTSRFDTLSQWHTREKCRP